MRSRAWIGRGLAPALAVLLAAAPAVLLSTGLAAPVAAAESPRDAVAETLEKVMTVLRNDDLSVEARREQVETLAYDRFDFETISRLVLARNWKRLDEKQRADFIVEFKRHLTESYWQTLYDNRGREVAIGASHTTGRGDVKVRTEIELDAAQPLLIDYRLREREGRWRVIDVTIEGVSLVQNFRAQTQEIISDVGVDRLIEKLRQKNDEAARS